MYVMYAVFGVINGAIIFSGEYAALFAMVPITVFSLGVTKWGMKWQNERYVRSSENQDDIGNLKTTINDRKTNIRTGEAMISIDLLLKHMAWANQEIYKEVQKLDDGVLDYYVIDPEWTVRTIMIHIAGASHLYGQRLNGEPFSRFELKNTDGTEMINELLSELDRIDQSLMKNLDREDEEFTYATSKGEQSSKVSIVLSQLIFHAGEHRAQIVAALDKHNERSINLDKYSVWSYVSSLN